MPKYFFAGGLYPSNDDANSKQFNAVSPNNGLPYIWSQPEYAKGIHHHASVYELSDDMRLGVMRIHGMTISGPQIVRLDENLQRRLREAIEHISKR